MIEMDLFHRAELKRLRYDLNEKTQKENAMAHEIANLRETRSAQGAVIETLQECLRNEVELNRHLQHESKKLWDMYRASEAARQRMAERARDGGREGEPSAALRSAQDDRTSYGKEGEG